MELKIYWNLWFLKEKHKFCHHKRKIYKKKCWRIFHGNESLMKNSHDFSSLIHQFKTLLTSVFFHYIINVKRHVIKWRHLNYDHNLIQVYGAFCLNCVKTLTMTDFSLIERHSVFSFYFLNNSQIIIIKYLQWDISQ